MKKIALSAVLLTATSAFAMSEQAKGSIDAANEAVHYMVLNKHCKYVPQAAVVQHADFVVRFASEFIDQHPGYAEIGRKAVRAVDAYLKVAPKAERQKICKQFKAKVTAWVESWESPD